MSVAEQSRNFCLFFIIGLFIGFIFDLFKSFRKNFKTNNLCVDIQDIVFLVISGFLFFKSVIVFNSGNIRFYIFVSTVLGITIYSLTLSESCVIIIDVILRFVKLIFRFVLKLLKLPYYFAKKNLKINSKKSKIKEWQYWEISLNQKRFVELLSQ